MSAHDPLLGPIAGATSREVGGVKVDVSPVGAGRVKRIIYPQGFRWSSHMKPITGTELCMHAHVGFLVRGHVQVRYADGCTTDFIAPRGGGHRPGPRRRGHRRRTCGADRVRLRRRDRAAVWDARHASSLNGPTPVLMQADVRRVKGVPVIHVTGTITTQDTWGQLKERVAGLVGEGERNIILNLSQLVFVDSSFIGELVACSLVLARAGERCGWPAPRAESTSCSSSPASVRFSTLTKPTLKRLRASCPILPHNH